MADNAFLVVLRASVLPPIKVGSCFRFLAACFMSWRYPGALILSAGGCSAQLYKNKRDSGNDPAHWRTAGSGTARTKVSYSNTMDWQ